MNIFLTGGTGFIGKQLLLQLSERSDHLFVLVRNLPRFQQILEQLGITNASNITPIIGDLTHPKLGIRENSYQQILGADVIIHAGGPMNIELQPKEAEQVFLQSAKEMVSIAKEIHALKGLQNFIHVVGFMSPYNEQNAMLDLSSQLEHAPAYEKMKFDADSYVRKNLKPLNIPLSVVNPSVVVGDSHNGATEQLGGLGILINSVRRNLMPLVPGGANYWLPLVHVDHLALFIIKLLETPNISSNTYYLLDSKSESPSIKELISMISKEMRVKPPVGTVPLGLLKFVLGLGVGKLLGIPKESMNFLVQSSFPVESKLEIESKLETVQLSAIKKSVNPSTLPFVMADLDFRLSHQHSVQANDFTQSRKCGLITLEKKQKGTPMIFIHGTFSGASSFVPVARYLENTSTWLIDLPGFGRTPYHHHPSIIDGYVEAVIKLVVELNSEFENPVTLVGHSFGGLIAAKVMEKMPEQVHKLLLLQPVLHPINGIFRYPVIGKWLLKHATRNQLKKNMLKTNSFITEDEIPADYIEYVLHDLSSPRVRVTTSEVMITLTHSESFQLKPESWNSDKVHILWGKEDSNHFIPKAYQHMDITYLPFGHQFIISQPEPTAHWIEQRSSRKSKNKCTNSN